MSNVVECIKCDSYRECDCKFSVADIPTGRFVCKNECVLAVKGELAKARAEIYRLTGIVEKYRAAFSPFVGVCRKVVEAADEQKGGAQ